MQTPLNDKSYEVVTGTGDIARFASPERADAYAAEVAEARRIDRWFTRGAGLFLLIVILVGLGRWGNWRADVVALCAAAVTAGIWFIIWRLDLHDTKRAE